MGATEHRVADEQITGQVVALGGEINEGVVVVWPFTRVGREPERWRQGAADGSAEEALGAKFAEEKRETFAKTTEGADLARPGGRVGRVGPSELPAAVERGQFGPVVGTAGGVDAAEWKGVAKIANGAA